MLLLQLRCRSFSPPSCSEAAAARASAHNRRMRKVLPRYLRRWLLVCAICAICAICAYAVCVVLVIGHAWCDLRLAER